jgi:hypothetical protein
VLQHFNTTPLQLTGNGKGTLFEEKEDQGVLKHQYTSESDVSTSTLYNVLDQSMHRTVHRVVDESKDNEIGCWLEERKGSKGLTNRRLSLPHDIDIRRTMNLSLTCPDDFQQSIVPTNRSRPGITVGLPYFAAPAVLLQQLANFASYPKAIQELMTIIVVDDGSPVGLRAMEYVNVLTNGKETSIHFFHHQQSETITPFYFRLRIARITTGVGRNVEGSLNLAFFLADTQLGLILDLDMIVPAETIAEALTWNMTKCDKQENVTMAVAHKFNRNSPGGKESSQPALGLLNVHEYWNAGGLDEDFTGSYGMGAEHYFWHLWNKGTGVIENHNASYLVEVDTAPCDSSWLSLAHQLEQCERARSKLISPSTATRKNMRLWRRKKNGDVMWSNKYLRFNWTVDTTIK